MLVILRYTVLYERLNDADDVIPVGFAASLSKPLQMNDQNVRQRPQPQLLLHFLFEITVGAMPRVICAQHFCFGIQLHTTILFTVCYTEFNIGIINQQIQKILSCTVYSRETICWWFWLFVSRLLVLLIYLGWQRKPFQTAI